MVDREPGPFEYYSDLHGGVTGDSIRADAEDPALKAATIHALADELEGDARQVAGQLSGDITADVQVNPETAQGTARTLAAKGLFAVGLVKDFADMVDAFDAKVSHLNWEYRTQLAMALRWEGQAAASTPDPEDDKRVDEAHLGPAVKHNLMPQYKQALATLDDDADTVASRFKAGPTPENVKELIRAGLIPLSAAALYPGLTLTDADKGQYWKHALADMPPADKARFLIEHREIDGAQLDIILDGDGATSDEIGRYVSDKALRLDHDSSDGDVREVVDLLDRFKDSHQASSGIVHELGGEGLVNLIGVAGTRMYMGKDERTALRLGQLTRDVLRSGEPALAARDPEASRAIARDMVATLRDPDKGYQNNASDQYAVSYLLRDSTLSTPFLDTMGDELDDLERNGFAHTDHTWRMQGSMPTGIPLLFDEGDREAAFDPVASYMSALGHNDEASLQFFTAGGENPHGADGGDRQEYWIERRLWSHDDFGGITSALDSATTGLHNLDDPASRHDAAQLMSNTVHLLAERHGLDFPGDGENFDPGDVSDEGTVHVAHMLSTYMSSVDQALSGQSGDYHGPGTQTLTGDRFHDLTDAPIFSAKDLRNMTDVSVSTDDGFNAMRQGVSYYQNMIMQDSIHQHGSIDNPTSQADAKLEGFFVNSVGDTKIADAEDKDARVQSWIDMGKDVVGEIPIPGGKAVEFLASHAIDAAADGLSDHYANNEDKEVDSENDYAAAALNARHAAAQQALVNAGAITPDDVASELGTSYTRAQVDAMLPGGRFPSQDQYDAMSTSDQTNLRNALATLVEERHLEDTTNYDQSYRDMFSEYFEKGDGDGN